MAHVTVFAHHKGGTGKTTSCVNIAGFLQQLGERSLVVDGDPQSNATSNLGLNPDELGASLYDLLLSEAGVRETDVRDCVYPTEHGVDVIPGSQQLHDGYNMLWNLDGRNETLRQAVERVAENYGHDHVLIDAPSVHLNAIASSIRAADSFYLVMDSSIFSQEGVGALKSFLRRLPERHTMTTNPRRVLYVEHKERSPLNRLKRQLLGATQETRSERVARSLFGPRFVKIPYCEAVLASQRSGTPLSHLENVPKEADVYEKLADELREYSW